MMKNTKQIRILKAVIIALVCLFLILKRSFGRGIIAAIVFIVLELVFLVFMVLTIRKERKSVQVLLAIAILTMGIDIVLQIRDIVSK